MLCRLHLRGSSRKALLQQPSLVLSGSDAPAAPLSSGGEGRELHRAPPIREPGYYSAPRLALWVNNLYPEILRPPTPLPPFLTNFFNSFFILFSLFSPSTCRFVSFVLFITVIFLFSPSAATSPPLPILPTEASKNKLSLCLPTGLLLCKTASATWRSLKVHVPNSCYYSCVVLAGIHICVCFSQFKLRIRSRWSYSRAQYENFINLSFPPSMTRLCCVTRNSVSSINHKQSDKLFVWIRVKLS